MRRQRVAKTCPRGRGSQDAGEVRDRRNRSPYRRPNQFLPLRRKPFLHADLDECDREFLDRLRDAVIWNVARGDEAAAARFVRGQVSPWRRRAIL